MTKDGLRRTNFRIINLDVAGSTTINTINVTGSATFSGEIDATLGSVTAGALIAYNDLEVSKSIFTSANNEEGTIINNIPAEAIISGGMWVVGSAASGTTMAMVSKPSASTTTVPLGICLGTTASGAFPNIQIKGQNNSIIADTTVIAGASVSAGSGGAHNTGITTTVAGRGRAIALRGAGSEGLLSVYLI